MAIQSYYIVSHFMLSEINHTELMYKTHIFVSDSTRFYKAKQSLNRSRCVKQVLVHPNRIQPTRTERMEKRRYQKMGRSNFN